VSSASGPTASDLRLEPFEGHGGLEAVRTVWDELVEMSGVDPVCNDAEWLAAYTAAFVPDAELFGWLARDESGRAVAAFAFRLEPRRGALALQRALLAQDGTFDSDYLEPPIRPGFEASAWSAVIDALARSRRAEALVLGCLPVESRTCEVLGELLPGRGLHARSTPYPCVAADLPDDFEAYLAGLKPRMRSKVRSALRRLEERGGTMRLIDDTDDLSGELERMFELHQRRWVAAGLPGSFADAARRRLYHELTPRWLASRRLRFARLDLDGRPVAYQFGALREGTYYQFQEGYDPDLQDLRPGVALRAWKVGRLIEEGATRYDFLAGASRHKSDWGGVERPCVTLAFPLPRLRARLAYAARAWVDRRRG